MRRSLTFLKPIFFTVILCLQFNLSLTAQPIYCATTLPTTPEPVPVNLESGCYPFVPGPFFIRIFPHVIRAAPNGSGGQSDAAIKQAIEIMRADFAPLNVFFVWDACDIDVIINNDLYTTIAPSLDDLFNHFGDVNGINLFFFPTDQGMGEFAMGKSTLPGKALYIGGEEEQWDGEVYTAMESRTLSHEMGHCLGLYHTFAQMPDRVPLDDIYCCDGPEGERVDGSNGCECGDYVDDTPAFYDRTRDGVSYPSCHFATTERDCNNDLYNPDEKNIMNYTYLPCREYFTPGQGTTICTTRTKKIL